MARFDVYTTDANPRHVHAGDGGSGDVDRWVDQLARVSTGPVDLFVDVPDARIAWTFRATRGNGTGRTDRYLADYRGEAGTASDDLFGGLYTELTNLSATGAWEFPDDPDPRWSAGFDLARVDARCPDLSADEEDALVRLVSGDWPQACLGMSSYPAALRTVKRLAALDADGTVAINSHGATAETEDVDLVLWPGADRDFQPVTAGSKDALARAGFRREADMTVADETPSESASAVKHRRESPSPVEAFVGDTVGRVGVGLSVFVAAMSLAGLADVGPFHPITGLAAIGGTAGAVLGLVAVQRFGSGRVSTDGGVPVGQGSRDAAASRDPADASPMLSTADWEWQQYGAFAGYWALLAFAFPTVFRLAGWPFGTTNAVGPTLVSAGTYVGVLLLVSLVAYGVRTARSDVDDHARNVGSLVVVHALFGVGLVAFAGLACPVWYDLIGFGGGC